MTQTWGVPQGSVFIPPILHLYMLLLIFFRLWYTDLCPYEIYHIPATTGLSNIVYSWYVSTLSSAWMLWLLNLTVLENLG